MGRLIWRSERTDKKANSGWSSYMGCIKANSVATKEGTDDQTDIAQANDAFLGFVVCR